MAGIVGQRVRREMSNLAIATGAMLFVRLTNRQADSPWESSDFTDSPE